MRLSGLPALLALFLLLPAPLSAAEEPGGAGRILVPDSEREVEELVRDAVDSGRKRVEAWFSRPYPKPFAVEVLASRSEMDAALARRWAAPKTACGIVAAGVADRLFVLSPRVWKTESCVKDASAARVGEVVAHELVHVFHGQVGPNGDFRDMDELAWFVEGVATLVSGQLDARAGEARAALAAGKGPKRLKTAWSGRYKVGVSGSLVRFVETRWDRPTVDRLLRVGTNAAAMAILRTYEGAFLSDWRKEVRKKPAR